MLSVRSRRAQRALQLISGLPLFLAPLLASAQHPGVASAGADSAVRALQKPSEPFAFADFTWLNGNSRQSRSVLASRYFTGEFRLDATYIYSANHPKDHTLVGSSESGRVGEVQVQQLGIGGDFHAGHARGRVMTQFGMYSQMTPRNDPSPARGQWNLDHAYRYLSEAYGGYHWDAMHGVNVDAGIFMSYVGLFSYYNFDNWAYQPSYVSSNTPWFFNGVRIQTFPSDKLKLEYWIVNGWQSYGMFNETPGLGMQILWRPNGAVSFISNDYWGYETPGNDQRQRWHSDNSLQWKYLDAPKAFASKGALSITVDAGCEQGGGVSCAGGSGASGTPGPGAGSAGTPGQNFLGFMLYDRTWFSRDRYAWTVGGGMITNPGRYLVLMPPINGATAASGTPYFTASPGDRYRAWDATVTFDVMPDEWSTLRVELAHREASVAYFAGAGGVTPPGGNSGTPGSAVAGWTPDLRKSETRLMIALLVKM
jgi:hypothetical protein